MMIITRFAILAVFLVASSVTWACRCTEPDPANAYQMADAVVTAKVLAVSGDPYGPGGAVATINVLHAWKANVKATLEVSTSTTCAYPFVAGEDVLLFLQREGSAVGLSTRRCLGNQPLRDAGSALRWLEEYGECKRVHAEQ